ncbi:MAG: hypothetical protein WDA26_01425 [Pusillimonas sp.]
MIDEQASVFKERVDLPHYPIDESFIPVPLYNSSSESAKVFFARAKQLPVLI